MDKSTTGQNTLIQSSDREEADDIVSEHVATDHQIADIMPKALGTEKFTSFRGRIGITK